MIKKAKKSIISNLQAIWIDLQKMDQHTGGKWLIHATKHHMDN